MKTITEHGYLDFGNDPAVEARAIEALAEWVRRRFPDLVAALLSSPPLAGAGQTTLAGICPARPSHGAGTFRSSVEPSYHGKDEQ